MSESLTPSTRCPLWPASHHRGCPKTHRLQNIRSPSDSSINEHWNSAGHPLCNTPSEPKSSDVEGSIPTCDCAGGHPQISLFLNRDLHAVRADRIGIGDAAELLYHLGRRREKRLPFIDLYEMFRADERPFPLH